VKVVGFPQLLRRAPDHDEVGLREVAVTGVLDEDELGGHAGNVAEAARDRLGNGRGVPVSGVEYDRHLAVRFGLHRSR